MGEANQFKARIALEAIKGEKTAAEIARENEIAPAQINEWKKQLEERLSEVFQSKGERSKELQVHERKEAQFERKIGQLVIEPERSGDRLHVGQPAGWRSHQKDFLLKKCKQLGIEPTEKP